MIFNWRQILTLSLLILGLAGAGWGFLDNLAEGNTFAEVAPGELYGDTHFGQTFVASYPGLYRIEVVVSSYGRHNNHEIIFHLKQDLDSPVDLVRATLKAGDVRDGRWHTFSFPPIPDSAGRSFYFYLESPESRPGDAITIMGREGDPYPSGQGFISGQPLLGDMAFRIYYRMTLWQKLDMVLDKLTDHKPSVWGNKHFYILLATLYVLFLGALLWQVSARPISGEESGE